MATVLTGWRGFKAYLEMIKIEHSIFALPFAMAGMVWGSVSATGSAWPGWRVFGLIVLAMVSCRSAAMAFNRIADRAIDAKNRRTAIRAIPAGLLSLRTANLYFYGSCLLFFVAAALLNPLAFALSPVALGITLVYSVTKRFTPLCHYILGLSLGIAPAAAWIAVTASLEWAIIPVFLGVAFWTAGFDIIYSLQDEEFDRENGLRSIPQTLGKPKALLVSRISHGVAIVLLAAGIFLLDGGGLSGAAVGLAATLPSLH